MVSLASYHEIFLPKLTSHQLPGRISLDVFISRFVLAQPVAGVYIHLRLF